MPPAIMTVHAD